MDQNAQKNIILALETSGRAGSIAVGEKNSIFCESFLSGQLKHNAELFTTIDNALDKIGAKRSSISEVYLTAGPGSFTGIRISVTMAKMMALASGVKIVAVPTLDALAENANLADNMDKTNRVAVVLDAKRSRFFVALYEKTGNFWQKIVPEMLIKASDFVAKYAGGKETLWLLGEGLVYYKDKFKADGIDFLDEKLWTARASSVYKVGTRMAEQDLYADPKTLSPIYLRQSDAEENLNRTTRDSI